MDSGMYTEREVQCLKEGIIDEALHLLEGYTDPPYPILAAYLGNLSGKHKPKALYLLQGAG